MAHYVFTTPNADDEAILAVAMNIDENEAMRIAFDLTRDLRAIGDIPLDGDAVDYQEVPAYVPRSPVVGDSVSAKIALILPVGSIIICTADAWGPVPASAPLIRQGGGYVRVNDDGIEPTPLVDDHLYKILHIGKTEPNHHGGTP